MEFAMTVTKSGKIETAYGEIRKSIQRFGEKENYKYLGILVTDTIKQAKIKEKLGKVSQKKKPSLT